MLVQVLKSKLKQVIVTDSRTDYEGSLILDRKLIEAANLLPYERVEVNSVDGQARIVTYVVPGNAGDVVIAGGAANHFAKGDRIHVNCFAFIDEWQKRRKDIREVNKKSEKVQVVLTDDNNEITEVKEL